MRPRVIPFWRFSLVEIMSKFKRRASVGTNQMIVPAPFIDLPLLKGRWDGFIETVTAQLMRFLESTHKIIFNVCENSIGYLFPGVSLFFCTPIFQAHTFLFQFLYFRRQRKMVLLFGDNCSIGLDNVAVQFIELSRVLCKISKAN